MIIEPVKKLELLEWLAMLDPIEEEFPNADEGLLPLRNINLGRPNVG